jgi:hypothetical protein
MVRGSSQLTPKQLLDAGRRAEAEGRLDLAHQFYGHLSDRYGHTPEATEGRHGLARLGAPGQHPQVWQMNGGDSAVPAANGRFVGGARRARHAAPRVEYRAGRALAAIVSGIGWLAIGMALLALAVGMTAELAPVPALQEFKLAYSALPQVVGALLGGAVTLLCGQAARALFDQASATRELAALERAKAGSDHS